MEAPKPASELKKLDYFAGNWKADGDAKAGPGYPGGKFSVVERNEWMKDGAKESGVMTAGGSRPGGARQRSAASPVRLLTDERIPEKQLAFYALKAHSKAKKHGSNSNDPNEPDRFELRQVDS
jgi:hypothetical protein